MCGSGTVLSLGVHHGHQMVGYDLDPLAVLMAQVATQPVDASMLGDLSDQTLATARRARASDTHWSDDETREFARYWFLAAQLLHLVRLTRAINELDPRTERDALQVGLSRLIVTKSLRASLAADTAHSRPHRVMTSSDYEAYRGFGESIKTIRSSLDASDLNGTAKIQRGDARDSGLFDESVDLVVTSTPYLSAIDYLRGHRLALIWLGYSLSELREIRSISVGSEAARDATATEKNEDLVRRVAPGAIDLAARVERLVARYAHDMLELAANVENCLVPGGRAVVVVADSVLKGKRVPTGDLVRTAMADKGMPIESVQIRQIPATLRNLPLSVAGTQLSKRMKHEYVITAAKSAS